ncbi:MAG: TadE/TadG family type IV pilus assembly protein [Maioricimonas sp. JB049]
MSRRSHRSTVRGVGQLVIDCALLLPVFVILACGLIEFSRAVAIQQAMQETVDEVTGADQARVSNVDLERSVRKSVADSLGIDPDRVEVHSQGDVVNLALQGETLSQGPVSFLAGTTLSARAIGP